MKIQHAQTLLWATLCCQSTSAAVIDRFFKRNASPQAIESGVLPGSPPQDIPDGVESLYSSEPAPVTITTIVSTIPSSNTTTTTTSSTTSSTASTSSSISTTSDSCIPLEPGVTVTKFKVVHTSTTTFTGDSSDYTPPYKTISTPEYCSSTATLPLPLPSMTSIDVSATLGPIIPEPAPSTSDAPTLTFITTDKNPAVVWESTLPPGFTSKKDDSNGLDPGNHQPPRPTAQPQAGKPSFTVTAKPGEVIINDSTIGGIKPGQTTTVVVGGGTFVIDPTAVVGEGATVERPVPVQPRPTSTNIGGVPVEASNSVVVVDGNTITVPKEGTVTYVNGQDVSAGPGTLIVNDETLTWATNSPHRTDAVVAGGEILTAVGQSVVVIHSTTITYGPDTEETTKVIDNDTIVIDENGVSLRGSTIGGPSAAVTGTTYEIVGGVTVTELGATLVAINGKTYTINDDTEPVTTKLGEETITVGPDGVEVADMTFGGTNGTVVATIQPKSTSDRDLPIETGSNDDQDDGQDDEEDGAFSSRPDARMIWSALAVAIGVWALGY